MPRILGFLALGLGVTAVMLRLPATPVLRFGAVEFTPATLSALAALVCGLGALALARQTVASKLLARANAEARPDRSYHLILGGLIVIGALLRVAHLGEYPLNSDEHLFVNSAYTDSVADVWHGVLHHLHPPANFYLLHFLQQVSVDPVWLRMPAVITGVLLIWLTARFAREFLSPLESLIVGGLVAFSPALIELSRVCRNYSPGFVLLVVALIFWARYMRAGRARDLFLFAGFELLALTWLYSLVIPLFAANLVLFGNLALRRRPIREWAAPFVIQLPVAAVMLTLYAVHIRVVSADGVSEFMTQRTLDEVFQRPRDFLLYLPLPVLLLFRFLLAGATGLLFAVLAVVGAIQLWITGRRALLVLCVLPFLITYAFSLAGMLPLGGNRQSSYLFPFVFLLTAASAPALLTGLAEIRDRLRSSGSTAEEATSPSPGPSGGGLMILAAIFAGFVYLSMGMQEETVFFDRQDEHPTTWADLERALNLIETRFQPDDLILVSFQALVAYNAYANDTATPFAPTEPMTIEVRGMRFHYSPEAGWFFSPESLIRAWADVKMREGLGPVDRVWTVRGAGLPWEDALHGWFNHDFPDVPKDDQIHVESRGWLFSVRASELRALLPEVADEPGFYDDDFLRTSYPPEARVPASYFNPLLPPDQRFAE